MTFQNKCLNIKITPRKIFIYLIIVVSIFSCNNDDDNICDKIAFPAPPSLFLRLVDNNGINLIENGTINPSDIVIVEGPTTNFDFVPPFSDENVILLPIPDMLAFSYVIQINGSEVFNLDFSTERVDFECFSKYIPREAFSNNEIIEIVPLRISFIDGFLIDVEL